MDTKELYFDLPEELIAQQALTDRSRSRLMVLDNRAKSITHKHFSDITDYLNAGDCLVLNETRVVPARFYLRRETGGQIEGLFLRVTVDDSWEVMLKNASRVKNGEKLVMVLPGEMPEEGASALEVMGRNEQNYWLLKPQENTVFPDSLEKYGSTPLPPYIKRERKNPTEQADKQRYQTVYARQDAYGSVAAPTAGLHFDDNLLRNLQGKGVKIARVILHVGPGTFKPVEADRLEDHQMHSEWFCIDAENADIINSARERGGRVIAVGTTSVRTLETCADINGRVEAKSGWTDIFIMPGYRFKVVRAIITNFHLPGSTLLALVSAFYGLDETIAAYKTAVKEKYRFYSFGDAMYIG